MSQTLKNGLLIGGSILTTLLITNTNFYYNMHSGYQSNMMNTNMLRSSYNNNMMRSSYNNMGNNIDSMMNTNKDYYYDGSPCH